METKATPRDSRLIDALEEHVGAPFRGNVWRVVREGRDPLQCSSAGGRWDDGTFDVLYTSLEADGAIAEMHFHLMKGQPVLPSRVQFVLYELKIELGNVLEFNAIDSLAKLGYDTARFGQLSYQERNQEYPRSQEIAEVAHFLDFDGLLVPSARRPCANLIVFCDRIQPSTIDVVKNHGPVDWKSWEERNRAALK